MKRRWYESTSGWATIRDGRPDSICSTTRIRCSPISTATAGIDKASAGTIEIGGVDIAELGEGELADWRAANVGFVFQFYNLLPVLSAMVGVSIAGGYQPYTPRWTQKPPGWRRSRACPSRRSR